MIKIYILGKKKGYDMYKKKTYKICKDIEGSKTPKWPFCMGGPTKMKVSHECLRRRLRSLKEVINGDRNQFEFEKCRF